MLSGVRAVRALSCNFLLGAVASLLIRIPPALAAQPSSEPATILIAPGFVCQWNGSKYLVAKLKRGSQEIRAQYPQKKLRRLKKSVKRLKAIDKAERTKKQARTLKKQSRVLTLSRRCARQEPPPPSPPPCDLTVSGLTLEATEGQELEVSLPAVGCAEAVYSLTRAPNHGSVTVLANGTARYRSRFNASHDSFEYRACQSAGPDCGPAATVSLIIGRGSDFSGRSDSLEPYREAISLEEKLHLVRKLALNNLALLDSPTVNMRLTEFLDQRIFNLNWVSPDLKVTLERLRDRSARFQRPNTTYLEEFIVPQPHWPSTQGTSTLLFTPSQTFNSVDAQRQGLQQFLMTSNREVHGGFFKFYWSTELLTGYLLTRARYEAPIRTLLMHFWLGHFGVTANTLSGERESWLGRYFKTIENNALGSFRRMMLGAAPQGCGTWQYGTSGIICDALANFYLDNHLNTANSPNENYTRELMELFTLGPSNLELGVPNYNDVMDVAWATNFMSGYEWKFGPNYSDYLQYNPARHSTQPRTVFAALGAHFPALVISQRSLTPEEFVNHLFDHHPGLRHFIARRLFAQLVYPDPPQSIVDELAEDLRASNYDIMPLLRKIARSEAFFSARATKKDCFEEPFKLFARVINGLGLPLVTNATGINATNDQRVFMRILTSQVGAAGEAVMAWPTIFSHDYCGRAPGKDGSGEWLKSSRLLGRATGMTTFLANQGWRTQNEFAYASIIDRMYDPYLSGAALEEGDEPSKSQVISLFARLLNVNLTSEEAEAIDAYLSSDWTGTSLQPVTWQPRNTAFMNRKVTGMIAIMAAAPSGNVQ